MPSTDQAILTSGLGQPELNAWERAVVMPRRSTGTPGYEQVMRLAEGGDLDEELRGYFRYWAGYTVLTRPVLAVWGIPGMRLVVGALLSVGAWMAAREVARRASARHVLALGLPLLAGTNILVTPSGSIAHALSFAVTFAGLHSWLGRTPPACGRCWWPRSRQRPCTASWTCSEPGDPVGPVGRARCLLGLPAYG